jgi:hypothetical protein
MRLNLQKINPRALLTCFVPHCSMCGGVKSTSGKWTRRPASVPTAHYDRDSTLLFGGHPPPSLEVPYQVTRFQEKKDAYHAICMMKVRQE